MGYSKKIVKATFITGLLYSNSMLATDSLLTTIDDSNELDKWQELKVDEDVIVNSNILEYKLKTHERFDRLIPPIYESDEFLLKLSTEDIHSSDVNKDNKISLVMRYTF